MSDLFDTLAPLRTSADMAAHVHGIIRHFPISEQWDTAEELIDRAHRRGAIDDATAASLRDTFRDHVNALS